MNKKIHYSWFMFIGCCIMQFTIVGAVINGAGLFYTLSVTNWALAEVNLLCTIPSAVP